MVGEAGEPTAEQRYAVHSWDDFLGTPDVPEPNAIDIDMAAIFYTSGSTGKPKGVVLSHRNLVSGGESVSHYLGNHEGDTILAVLPLSFDAGFSQLTTGFTVGAHVVLVNYLLPRDVVKLCAKHRVTGLTCVPPLWLQLTEQDWPEEATSNLRYFANTGGRMPKSTLDRLRALFPQAKPFLMYGLTEAFRSTYLDPAEVDRRPDSIGKAIPNAEILVVREDGSRVRPGRARRARPPRRAGGHGLLERRGADRRAVQAGARAATARSAPPRRRSSRATSSAATRKGSCTSSAARTR